MRFVARALAPVTSLDGLRDGFGTANFTIGSTGAIVLSFFTVAASSLC
jgi:hypothetical protein